jgi:hypothetical protein
MQPCGRPKANGEMVAMNKPTPKCNPPKEPLITDVELRGLIAASNLTPTQRGTLLMMADGLYRDDLKFRIGIQRLADSLGLGRRATFVRVRSLESSGAIRLLSGGGGHNEAGRGITNVWLLDVAALKQQALDRDALNHPDDDSPDKSNGADSRTDKGESEQRDGCSIQAHTVQQPAHDPISPIDPKKESNKEYPTDADFTHGVHSRSPIRQRRKRPDGLNPWVNRYEGPKQLRADRLSQMRTQLQRAEKIITNKPINLLDSTKEGK